MPFPGIRFLRLYIFVISNIRGHNKLYGNNRNHDGAMGGSRRDHICDILQPVFHNILQIPDRSKPVQGPVRNKPALVVHNTPESEPAHNRLVQQDNNGDNNTACSQHSYGSQGRQRQHGRRFVRWQNVKYLC